MINDIRVPGPLEPHCFDSQVSEILINGHEQIWIEREGTLFPTDKPFRSEVELTNFIHELCGDMGSNVDMNSPFLDGRWGPFRIHLAIPPLCQNPQISMRRVGHVPWSLRQLQELEWADDSNFQKIQSLLREKKNFLVVGATGSGKTSVLDACLQAIGGHERALILEDTDELHCPNAISSKLLTRPPGTGHLRPYDLNDLVRQSLRMRPDRLIIGEVRGGEAKDLLLALATGHRGSMGTLHADSAEQALLRLEMLVQLGSPQWSVETVRKLIHLSLHHLVVVHKDPHGKRKLQGIYHLGALEPFGILIDRDD